MLAFFLDQFRNVLVLVLLGAAGIAAALGELRDALVILVIVVLNALIGLVQAYRAERALAALRSMAAPQARVRRAGAERPLPAADLVPGDIVILEAGDVVPADLRLLDARDLAVDESALTGEAVPVMKGTDVLEEAGLPVGDRVNLAFKGTSVTRGRGEGVVVATGMGTELGAIATLLEGADDLATPLQQRLARFSRRLAVGILGTVLVLFLVGLLRGEPLLLMFLTAVSLAVAAIPEALPAVVTISLALGARKMSRRNALIRRLPAVETLGAVTWICSDKTGTLTRNEMHVEALFADGRRLDGLDDLADDAPLLESLGQALALCTDVVPAKGGEAGGDPTEIALFRAARAAGYDKASLERRLPRIGECAFDARRRAMSTLHRTDGGVIAYTKGAPEAILPRCVSMLTSGGPQAPDGAALSEAAQAMAREGHRVLAVARRRFDAMPASLSADEIEAELELLALVGMMDPPRDEVPQAIEDCRTAGIQPVMITGDHPGTALAIAERLGLAQADGRVLTGRDLERMDAEELAACVTEVSVYARVDPAQKIDIVRALQARGQFVAMTGDGVNDAPALKRADIGVAMGRKGTDVAREAADTILLDDNFATITRAVREGRRVFDNIRKFIKYTMTSNAGEILVLFLAPLLGLPLPLLPVQILWVNLVTDGLPGLALAAEPAEPGIMRRPPRPPGESLFAKGLWQHIVWVGLLIGGLSVASQAWALAHDIEAWQTVVFTTLTFAQLAQALVIRSETESLLSVGLFSNLPLLAAVLFTVGLQLAVIYLPWLNGIFHTQPLALEALGVCFMLPVVVVLAIEGEKWLRRNGINLTGGVRAQPSH